jgi:O-antigen/teichoic acid export membrane protein
MGQFDDSLTVPRDLLASPADKTELTARELQLSASRGSLWTMAHTVLAIPIAFIANALVARILGPAEYGSLAVLTLVMSLAVQSSNFGVSDGIQQWGAAAHARGDHVDVDRFLQSSLGFHLGIQWPILIAVAIFLGRGQNGFVIAALIASISIPLLFGSAAMCVTIENRTAQAARLAMLTNLLVQGSVALTAVVGRTPTTVWAARSLAGAILAPACLILLSPARRRVSLQAHMPRNMPAGFWRFSFITGLTGLVGILVMSRSEVLVMEQASTPAAIGVYALAFGIAAQMRGPIDALLGPLAPSVSGIVEVHQHLAAATLQRALRITCLLSGALLVAALPVASILIPLIYGQEYRSASWLILPLAAVALSQSLANPLLAFSRAQRRSGSLFNITIISLLMDLGAAVAAVPLWGAWGAVMASCVGQLTIIVLLARLQIQRGLLTVRRTGEVAVPFISAAICSATAVAVIGPTSLPRPIAAIVATTLAILAWIGALWMIPSQAIATDLRAVVPHLPRLLRQAADPFIALLSARNKTKCLK